MEPIDLLITFVVVMVGVVIFGILSTAFFTSGNTIIERCKSHKWQYNEKNRLVCTVCKYEAHSD